MVFLNIVAFFWGNLLTICNEVTYLCPVRTSDTQSKSHSNQSATK